MHKPFLFLALLILFSCGNEESKGKVEEGIKYPNQDAPLALLMREMFLDMEEIRVSVEEGKTIRTYIEEHKKLLTAKPTDAGVKTETFQTMGISYLAGLKQLEQSSEEALLENYKSLVNSCLACHNNFCPGPVKRINLLKLD
ncbi:hypothetical protein [Belliella aquatica]|uniref:Cytochrome C n=1 Tax=Belliella aquatica TaxID=1323734 RepID=A0ABQ1MFB5_9BACT|nr:hypothetical protein [Belliella aquatica]MCH7405217.1 hypothetical protein [Belliella aquatica]GGC38797.1 hypothetical protein GCM10010993_16980 [Belliella aquatica]